MTVSIKEYVDKIFDEREMKAKFVFSTQQDALKVAHSALDRELEHLNKLREEIIEDRKVFLNRSEFVLSHDALKVAIGEVEKHITVAETQFKSLLMVFGIIVSLVTAVSAGVSIWLHLVSKT